MIETREDKPEDVAERRSRDWLREGFREVGQYWFEKYLPLHFRPGNRRRYGLKPRSAAYERRKKALAASGRVQEAGLVDLVFSGDMRDVMTRAATMHAFPTRITVVVQAPHYVTRRPRGSAPDEQAEVLSVRADEHAKLEAIQADHYEQELKAFRHPRTTRHR